ncbi:hypothetical protein J6590_034436, partial [Homalodisca vitripennis]
LKSKSLLFENRMPKVAEVHRINVRLPTKSKLLSYVDKMPKHTAYATRRRKDETLKIRKSSTNPTESSC